MNNEKKKSQTKVNIKQTKIYSDISKPNFTTLESIFTPHRIKE